MKRKIQDFESFSIREASNPSSKEVEYVIDYDIIAETPAGFGPGLSSQGVWSFLDDLRKKGILVSVLDWKGPNGRSVLSLKGDKDAIIYCLKTAGGFRPTRDVVKGPEIDVEKSKFHGDEEEG